MLKGTPWQKNMINGLLFMAGWFACVLGGNNVALAATVLIVIIHITCITSWKKEGKLLTLMLLVGSAIDSLLGYIGLLQFGSDRLLLPVWLACLWLLFSTTLRHSLAWMYRYKCSASVAAAVVAPFNYYSGAKLAGIGLAQPLWQPLLIISLIWVVLIFSLLTLSSACQEQ
ncbi:DUF2878 domain-containing protein [Candidatus Sororendozoicomonas aggregata]|uniref:DUF2878 domain-containing protein n=1 Tax=Candidatus Sororendozoicomonas aggregata TaxID=3073239 RepID=UPI002ED44A10